MTDRTPALGPGLWGVLATPFRGPDLEVDETSLRRQVRLHARVGSTGLVALGVFGEGASLSSSEQSLVVRTVASEWPAAPLVVGLSGRSTAVVVEQASAAVEAAGAQLAAVMVQVTSADPDVLSAHLTAVHRATGAAVVVQDYPLTTGVHVQPSALLSTVQQCPFVVAVKSEAPPTAVTIAELTATGPVPVFGGLGGVGLLDELAAGAAGAMTGFSHPEGLQAALAAWRDGGYRAARTSFAAWLPLVNFEAQPGIGLAVRKELLRRRGVFDEAAVRQPGRPLPPQLSELMDAHLDAVASEVTT